MTKKAKLKFDLYRIFLNSDQGKMTATEHALFHHLATDDEVADALSKQNRGVERKAHRHAKAGDFAKATKVLVKNMTNALKTSRRMAYGHGCSVAGCGCRSFRAKLDSMVYCKCSHLTHDHCVKKRR